MHPELRLTFFTLSSGVVSQNVRTEEIFSKRNGPVMLRNHLTNPSKQKPILYYPTKNGVEINRNVHENRV